MAAKIGHKTNAVTACYYAFLLNAKHKQQTTSSIASGVCFRYLCVKGEGLALESSVVAAAASEVDLLGRSFCYFHLHVVWRMVTIYLMVSIEHACHNSQHCILPWQVKMRYLLPELWANDTWGQPLPYISI